MASQRGRTPSSKTNPFRSTSIVERRHQVRSRPSQRSHPQTARQCPLLVPFLLVQLLLIETSLIIVATAAVRLGGGARCVAR